MNTANLPITTPFVLSGYDACDIYDHYIFRDPVSGYNIFYPLTAYGGPMSEIPPFTFTFVASGRLTDECIQDFCYKTISIAPVQLFCIATLSISMSGLDQSVSKINKIVYNFGDGTPSKIVSRNLVSNISPTTVVISKTFYPAQQYVKEYTLTITVCYDNSCLNTYIVPTSSFGCSILEMYENTMLLNSQQTKQQYDVVLTLENQGDRQLFNSLLKTNEPVNAVPNQQLLPYVVEPVPPVLNKPVTTVVPIVTSQPYFKNPIVAPLQYYEYKEGNGIDLSIDQIIMYQGDMFISHPQNASITISGTELPFTPTPSVLITV